MSARRVVLVLAVVALAVFTAACSGLDPDQTGAVTTAGTKIDTSPGRPRIHTERIDAIAAQVPPDVRARGTLRVGTTGNGNPPLSFRASDNRTIIGMEPDVAQLVADVLGLRLDLRPTSWENLFIGMDSGQYDAGFSNITVTEERKEKYDFASYRVDSVSFEAANGGRVASITKPADVSGLTIGVAVGTNQEQILLDWNRDDEAHGLAPADIRYYQTVGDYYLALESGRLDAYLGPNPGVAYHVATSGSTKVVGRLNGSGTTVQAQIAAATKRGDGLAGPMQQALDAVIANGRYRQVLASWNLADEGLPASQINPPGLPRRSAS